MDFGTRRCDGVAMKRRRSWPSWARMYVQVFRTIVVATCLVAAAFGWYAHVDWLLAAGLTIGLGELLECTYYLVVLDWGARRFSRDFELQQFR